MKVIKVLGSGCKKCEKTCETIQQVAAEKHVAINLIKETNPEQFLHYGVMRTPAVVVDEILVHSGSIPHKDQIEGWL